MNVSVRRLSDKIQINIFKNLGSYKEDKMAELRWNPLIKDWVMIASHRQGRPQMPKDWCPFARAR